MSDFYLPAIRIRGFRSFRDILFQFNRLEIIIGANGSGKTSLFSFLRFLRDSCSSDIPYEIMPGAVGDTIFHNVKNNRIFWNAQIDYKEKIPIFYQAEMERNDAIISVLFERILTKRNLDNQTPGGFTFLDFRGGRGLVRDPSDGDFLRKEWIVGRGNLLGLGAITDAGLSMLFNIRSYIRKWRFYSGSTLNIAAIRHPVSPAKSGILDEDCGNLSAILFQLTNEHPEALEDLKSLIRFAIPGFKNLSVRPVGIAGEVMTFWEEEGMGKDLSFPDLSDGILRFIALATLCVVPEPPSLICIDDVGHGLHPRTLPVLAGLIEKASERTQVLLSTHASYFLTQFDLDNISIMKKSDGISAFVNVRNSQALYANLQKVAPEDVEQMYRADELEAMF